MSISTVYRLGTFDLLHPELRSLTRSEAVGRATFPWKFFKPSALWINWYGAAVREGGQGMYMTEAQAMVWPMVDQGDIKHGPA